jgi:4-amino-4-deoxy-L-arabinose transferase-like glycosyltransferase
MALDKKTLIFLTVILLLGCFFRLWQLDSIPPGLYHDEAMNGNNALEALETKDFKWFYQENNGREGLYVNLAAIPLSIFGNESWALRLLSAIFGMLTILGLFLLARELFNTRIALFSSFFLAISFWHILFSRIGFRAIMAPFFLVWAFYFLWKAIKHSQQQSLLNGGKRLWWALSAGLLFGLGFHSYIAFRIAPFLLIIPFWVLWKKPSTKAQAKKIIGVFLISAFIAGLPLGLYFLENPQDFLGRTSQISIFSSDSPIKDLGANIAKTIGMFFFVGDYNWRHNLAGAPQLWWPVSLLFLLGLFIGTKGLIQKSKRKNEFIFLFLWILFMSLPVVISSEGLPHALRAIVLIIPLMIFAGLGLELIVKKTEKWLKLKLKQYPDSAKQILRIRKKLVILLLVFFLLLTAHSFAQYFLKWGESIYTYHAFNGRYWDIGKYLKSLPAETPKYVIVNAGGVMVKGIPMPAQTVMFAAKKINYLLPEKIDSIKCLDSCVIITLESDAFLREKIKQKIPELQLDIKPGIEVLIK